jgi:hypothetical protein
MVVLNPIAPWSGHALARATRSCLPLAISALLVGGGGGSDAAFAKDTHPPAKPPDAPVQFGTGDDAEHASEFAAKVLRRELARQGIACEECLYGQSSLSATEQTHTKRFLVSTEATSSTRTHLLVQFDGTVVSPRSRKRRYVEYRVLIAVRPHNTLTLSMFSEHAVPRSRVYPREEP